MMHHASLDWILVTLGHTDMMKKLRVLLKLGGADETQVLPV